MMIAKRFWPSVAATLLMGLSVLCVPGCVIPAAIGGMAESYHRTGSSKVQAQYRGIEGKSFAVVATASRLIEAEHAGLTARLIQRVNDRLIINANPSYAIPSGDLITVLFNTPQWPAMTRGEVAEMLGVERLVVIEIIDYSLHEPGNQYLWDGVASAMVSVYEADSGMPDDPIFERAIRVAFPDARGFMRIDIPEEVVTTELSNRLVNRIAWLFYDHMEPNALPY
ncbi:MAG: hypothetical protein LAT64_03875 [Phycisphaerales bacterium]|nr:hypothetical protein [Planctomycetota bacterium]MCH8507890.1 hypothetical protein [Phycisphaerales bacterium]